MSLYSSKITTMQQQVMEDIYSYGAIAKQMPGVLDEAGPATIDSLVEQSKLLPKEINRDPNFIACLANLEAYLEKSRQDYLNGGFVIHIPIDE